MCVKKCIGCIPIELLKHEGKDLNSLQGTTSCYNNLITFGKELENLRNLINELLLIPCYVVFYIEDFCSKMNLKEVCILFIYKVLDELSTSFFR